ncbi:hypothetical protein AB0Q95_34860 [Streptomyces sp. NPDC059900]|uniref:hypothetical protein n=2 Tax=Streptomyces sp. NPDC059900 TaxID=3155816 RepID=UPI00341C62DF
MKLSVDRASALTGIAAVAASAMIVTAVPAFAGPGRPGSGADAAASVVENAIGSAGLTSPRADEGSLVADAAGTRVEMPATGSGEIAVTDPEGTRVGIGLPGSAAAPASATANGTVMYTWPDSPVDLAAQVGRDGSASALITLKNASAPTEYRFPLDLPTGARATLLDEGGVVVGDSAGEVVGLFDASWAKDANGEPVPTSYRIEGDTLVQTIRTDASTAYPVVADPKWWDKTKEIAGGMVSDTWNSMKCGAALAAAFAPGKAAFKVIKNAGGVKKVLATLASVDTKKGAMAALGSGGSTLFGIKSVKKACYDGLK